MHPNGIDVELNDIILNEGGTFADIFELIKILLTFGLEFTEEVDSPTKLYTKIVNGKKITIRVIEKPENNAVRNYLIPGFEFASIILRNYEKTKKTEGSAGDMDVSGSSELADMLEEFMEEEEQAGHVTTVVTDDFRESMEEEKQAGHVTTVVTDDFRESMEKEKQAGHVITIVTDNNKDFFFYNGWMYNNIVTPLQSTNGTDIPITTNDDKTLYFDLVKSSGIMILFKV